MLYYLLLLYHYFQELNLLLNLIDKIDTTEINQNLTITAQYKQKVVTEDPKDKDYVKVDFSAEEDAIFETWDARRLSKRSGSGRRFTATASSPR